MRTALRWKDPWEKDKIDGIAMLLDGAIKAYSRVGLLLNVRRDDLDNVIATLPSLRNPHHFAVERSKLGGHQHHRRRTNGAAVHPELKTARAEGIVEIR